MRCCNRDSLLVLAQDPTNRDAWKLFARIDRPVTVRIALARGLHHEDAQDVSHDEEQLFVSSHL